MESVLLKNEFEKTLAKIRLYIGEEEKNVDSINNIFTDLLSYYRTSNSGKLSELNSDLNRELKKINNNSNVLNNYLNDTEQKYVETSSMVTTIFENIEKEWFYGWTDKEKLY